MKISDKPTEWVAVRATSWDDSGNVDFILMRMTKERWDTVERRMAAAARMKLEDKDFEDLNYLDGPEVWGCYEDEFEDHEAIEEVLDRDDWCYVEYSPQEILPLPSDSIDGQRVVVGPDFFYFRGYGESTGHTFVSAEMAPGMFEWEARKT